MGGKQVLNLAGEVVESSLLVTWSLPEGYHEVKLRIDKCQANMDCEQFVYEESITRAEEYLMPDGRFSQCTLYNIHIESAPASSMRQILREEISIQNDRLECYLTENIVLPVGFSLLVLLLLVVVGLVCYYTRRHPLHNISRVRSRLYSRLYSQERYQQPVKKVELNLFMAGKMTEPEPFAQEFDRLEKLASDTIQRRTTVAEFPASRRRNRYKDIVPFDSNRVLVQPPYTIAGDLEPSDYINASFVSDVNLGTARKYIAAQGPGEETAPAFWSMIWQYDTRLVVMLTNLVEGCGFNSIKCSKYWPDSVGDIKRFGDMEVQLFDQAEAPNYIVRKLDVAHKTLGGASRVIVHIQFTSWMDRSTPACQDPGQLVQLVQLSRVMYNQFSNKEGDTPSPLLVHCSAGVGRTGTFICVDQLMRAIDSRISSDIDIFYTTYQLRRDRRYMVQTRAQYEYVYRCTQAYLAMKEKKISASSTSPSTTSPA